MIQYKTEQIDKLQTYLQSRQPAMVALLRRLVEAETPSSDPRSQEAALSILTEALELIGFTVEHIPGQLSGGQLLAWPKQEAHPLSDENERPIQLLVGHSDTVWAAGTLETMPFEIDDEKIRGPGVYDMKGGLVQMLFALQASLELNWPMSLMPLIFINTDEEIGSPESTPMIRKLAQRAARAFILEPALGREGRLKTGRKGVGRFKIEIEGRAAHAGLDPEKGVSAVLELSYIIQNLHALNDPPNGISVNIGVIEGGVLPNVIPASASALIDIRVPTVAAAKKLEAAVLALEPHLTGVSIEMSGGFTRQPMEQNEANQRLWRLAQGYGRQLGLDLEQGTAGGGSDGNTTSLYTATLDGLGAVGDGAHATHEFLFAEKMVERTALLALLLMSPAAS